MSRPAPPFPELYAVPGTDTSVFLHVKFAWDRIEQREYAPTSRVIQTALSVLIRQNGDLALDSVGLVRRVRNLEMSIAPFHTGQHKLTPDARYGIRYSVARASVRALENLYRIYNFYEVEANIHMFDYDENRPDGYIIVIKDHELEALGD
ncbi:MAG: hypothetical protein Q9216_007131 [Gyalolechia sp. 2 TL-2023]